MLLTRYARVSWERSSAIEREQDFEWQDKVSVCRQIKGRSPADFIWPSADLVLGVEGQMSYDRWKTRGRMTRSRRTERPGWVGRAGLAGWARWARRAGRSEREGPTRQSGAVAKNREAGCCQPASGLSFCSANVRLLRLCSRLSLTTVAGHRR